MPSGAAPVHGLARRPRVFPFWSATCPVQNARSSPRVAQPLFPLQPTVPRRILLPAPLVSLLVRGSASVRQAGSAFRGAGAARYKSPAQARTPNAFSRRSRP
ncbi:hypothetical protein AURDEDRAFT_118232 [Auricularia subglabra TFB-10046 SS5]|uniref:Uncharacterized protein n=1 Tax=Auricularia subglabra (strain TFB-10046 / SS5) TaxID=717982 RepID=J0CPV1_AURST|nr:hypothetical protein AURDEDRAFT_118232 [Auricularia subglabra TFB-10046 SS5]